MQPIPRPILLMEQIRHPPVDIYYISHYLQGFQNIQNGGKRWISEPSTVSHPNHTPNLDASKFWEVFQVELKTGSFNVFRILAAVDVLKRATTMDPRFFRPAWIFFGGVSFDMKRNEIIFLKDTGCTWWCGTFSSHIIYIYTYILQVVRKYRL